MHREYFLRATIVFLCVLTGAVVVGMAALFPADIRARLANGEALKAISTAKKSNSLANLDDAEKRLSQTNALLTALGAGSSQVRFSSVIRSIVDIRSSVVLSSFSMSREGTTTVSVTLQGVAPTRNDLLAFKGRLEALSPGSTVDLPISILAKNTDVHFSLKLTEHLK